MNKVLFVPGMGDTPKGLIDKLKSDLKDKGIDMVVRYPCEKRLDADLTSGEYSQLILFNDQTRNIMEAIESSNIFRPIFNGTIHNVMRWFDKENDFLTTETRRYGADFGYRVGIENLDKCQDYSQLLKRVVEVDSLRTEEISKSIAGPSS